MAETSGPGDGRAPEPSKRREGGAFPTRGLVGAIRLLSISAAVVAIAAAAIWFVARHEVADLLVRHALSGTPLADAAYTVSEVGTDGMALTGVSLPGVGGIGRVELAWSPRLLLDGRIDSARLSGVDLALRLDGDGATAFPPAAPSNGRDGDSREPFPFEDVVIEDADIVLEHPLDTVRLRLDGALRATGFSLAGSGRWRAEGAFGRASGAVSVESDPASGRDGVVVSLDDGDVAWGGLEFGGLSGRVDVESLFDSSSPLRVRIAARSSSGRIRGLDVGAATAEGSWDGRSITADVGFGVEGTPLSASVSIVSGMAGNRLRVAATGALAVREPMPPPMAGPVDLDGPASLDFVLEAFVSPDRPTDLHAADLTGRIDLETGAASLPGEFSFESSALSFDVAARGRRLRLTARPGGTIRGARAPSPEAAGGIVAAALDRALDLTVPPEGIVVDVAHFDDAFAIAAVLAASFEDGEGVEGRFSVLGDVELAADGAPVAFDVPAFEVAVSGALAPRGVADAIRVAGDVAGTPDGFDGALTARVRLDTLSAAGVEATGVVLDLPLKFDRANGETRAETDPVALFQTEDLSVLDTDATGVLAELPLRFEPLDAGLAVRLADTAWIDIRALRHPRLRSHRPTSLKLEAELLPLLVVERFGEDWSWDARLLTGPTGVRLELANDDGKISVVDGTLPSMGVRFGSLGRRHLQGTVETEGGDILIEGPDIRLADIRVLFTYNNGLSEWPQATADIRVVEDVREPARFAPLAADISIAPVWPLGDDVRFNGTLHMGERRFLANVEASYRPSDDLFRALIRVPPVRFERGGSQPEDVSPLYGGLLEAVSGAVELRGEVAVDGGVASSDLTLFLLDLSGRNGDVAIEGLEGEVTFSNVDPLSTPPNQTLTADMLDVGVSLTDLTVALALPGDGGLRVESASAGLAGGRVAIGPSVLRFAPANVEAVLDVRSIDLATLLAGLDVPGIETDARLTGSIPIRLTGGDVAIARGRLDADSPGLLRYVPDGGAAPSGLADGSMDLVLEALSNFRFRALGIDIDRSAGGGTEVRVHIAGANPDLHDGYPVELNVSLSGDVDDILLNGLGAWRIPEEIRERLEGF